MYISEYDVAKSNDQEQLDIFKEQFPVLYEHPNVVGVTIWGYIDGQTWRAGSGLIKNGQRRPAMNWLIDYLKKFQ
jgi:GH35 family endo-1,4-beta-xylanase